MTKPRSICKYYFGIKKAEILIWGGDGSYIPGLQSKIVGPWVLFKIRRLTQPIILLSYWINLNYEFKVTARKVSNPSGVGRTFHTKLKDNFWVTGTKVCNPDLQFLGLTPLLLEVAIIVALKQPYFCVFRDRAQAAVRTLFG